jgi:hypothetical protein
MRLLRLVITVLAVAATFVGGLALVAIGFVVFVLLRLFGRPANRPRFQSASRRPTRTANFGAGEVIDVAATRVND